VGVDGSEPGYDALEYAAHLVEELRDAELVVVHVRYVPYLWMPDHAAEDEFADLLDGLEQQVRDRTQFALANRGVAWRFELREGEPAHELLAVAHAGLDPTIVVGRRGRATVGELLLGSVSNRVVHQADCPVLLVR
jgi:nucleotide-binding universal stress UspA family protein